MNETTTTTTKKGLQGPAFTVEKKSLKLSQIRKWTCDVIAHLRRPTRASPGNCLFSFCLSLLVLCPNAETINTPTHPKARENRYKCYVLYRTESIKGTTSPCQTPKSSPFTLFRLTSALWKTIFFFFFPCLQ